MCHSYYKLAGGSVSTESLNEYLFFVVAISFTVFTELWSIGSTPVSFPFRIVFRPVKTPALFAMMPKRPKFSTTWLQKLGHLLSNPQKRGRIYFPKINPSPFPFFPSPFFQQLAEAHQALMQSLADELLTQVRLATPSFFELLMVDLMIAMGYGGSVRRLAKRPRRRMMTVSTASSKKTSSASTLAICRPSDGPTRCIVRRSTNLLAH